MPVAPTNFTPFPKDKFKDLIAEITQVQSIWEGEKMPFLSPKDGKQNAILILDVDQVQQLGIDEVRQDWQPTVNGDRGANNVYTGGQRVYRINFVIKSFAFDTPGYDPLEDLRLKLRWGSTLERLQAMGVSVVKTYDINDLEAIADNREIWAAQMQGEFGFAPFQTVLDDEGGIIGTVNGGVPFVSIGDIPFTRIP